MVTKKSESQNSSTPISQDDKIDVRAKLAKTASVSTDTYSKGKGTYCIGMSKYVEECRGNNCLNIL